MRGCVSHARVLMHTCFDLLLLPGYGSVEKLDRMLTMAMHNAEGVGLEPVVLVRVDNLTFSHVGSPAVLVAPSGSKLPFWWE